MHSYVNSLQLFKNHTRESLKVSHITGTMSLIGLLVGGGISYLGNHSTFWTVVTTTTTTFAAFIASTCFDGFKDAESVQIFLKQHENNLDKRFVRCLKQSFQLQNLQFSNEEIRKIAIELMTNNLYDGLENQFVRKFIPSSVINEIKHLKNTPPTPAMR